MQVGQRELPPLAPRHATAPKVAVIGAGISGLACAHSLAEHGLEVTVFEKSRGKGGRLATRRVGDRAQFDHGAQYFTVRDERFRQYVEFWLRMGIVEPWNARIVAIRGGSIEEEKGTTDRFVAVPGMSSVCRQLATGLEVRTQTRIAPPTRQNGTWLVLDHEGREQGRFDAVIVSAPAPQSAELLRSSPQLAARAASVTVDGCWAVMTEFASRLPLDYDAAFVHGSPLSWVARNSSKPQRNRDKDSWILHASPDWTRAFGEGDADSVSTHLLKAFWEATGQPAVSPDLCLAHRWRYALPADPLPERCLFDNERQIGACGDWCGGPRVEGAMLSGLAAADHVLGLTRRTAASAADLAGRKLVPTRSEGSLNMFTQAAAQPVFKSP